MAKCSSDDCNNAYKSHRWGRQKAQEEGWFFERNTDRVWCPEHLPGWVKAWRIREYRKHVPKSSPFKCRTCGWGGTHTCVVGKIDSPIWLKQIPLHRWHATRVADYKKLHAKEQRKDDYVERTGPTDELRPGPAGPLLERPPAGVSRGPNGPAGDRVDP